MRSHPQPNLADLVASLEQALLALGAGRARPPLTDVWEVYWSEHVRRQLTPSGQDMARYSWNNLVRHFGGMGPHQVDQASINRYEDLRSSGTIGRPAKPVTVRRELAYLFAAMRYCAGRRLLSFDDIQAASLPKVPFAAKRHLTIAELQRIFEVAALSRLSDNRLTRLERFLWLALQTGARKTAILRLTWDRVDLVGGWIDFNEPGQVATKKRRSIVPISAAMRVVLERSLAERETEYVLDTAADTIWASLQVVAARAFGGAPTAKGKCPRGTGIGPHTLRHTAASLMAQNGVPLFMIAGVLGNTTQVTERVYAHHAPSNPAAVDKITGGSLPPPIA